MKKISLQQAVSIAHQHYQSKQYRQVKHILQPFIQHGVQSVDISYFMASAHYCLDEYEQAVEAYHCGIQINPDFAILHAGLGNTYVQLEFYDAAIKSYNQAITINPDYLDVYYNLVYVYSVTEQVDQAITLCGQILDRECTSDSLEIVLESKYDRSNPSSTYLAYIDMYCKLHIDGDLENNVCAEMVYGGKSVVPWITIIKDLIILTNSKTLLDYGSGKGFQYQRMLLEDRNQVEYQSLQNYWNVSEIYCYDPGYAPYRKFPRRQYDAVILTDVLEHCYQEDVRWILAEVFGLARKFVFANIACYKARQILPNGDNAHCTIRPTPWWNSVLDLVASDYPEVKYCVLVEFIWSDVKGEGSVFQMLSNFAPVDITLDPFAITILEANENLVPYVPYSVRVDSQGVLYR